MGRWGIKETQLGTFFNNLMKQDFLLWIRQYYNLVRSKNNWVTTGGEMSMDHHW